jgi:hypothetical protein
MTAILYTTTDAIRGCFGITDNELLDEFFVNQRMDLQLELDLDSWVSTHATIYSEGIAESPTAEQTKKWNYLQLYSQWFCAELSIVLMQSALPSQITDGKAGITRGKTNYEALSSRALFEKEKYKTWLTDLIADTTTVPTGPSLFSSVEPGYDPVTDV